MLCGSHDRAVGARSEGTGPQRALALLTRGVVPLARVVQLVPPLVVEMMRPLSPTAVPVSVFRKAMLRSVVVVPLVCEVHVSPPLVVRMTLPRYPTAVRS